MCAMWKLGFKYEHIPCKDFIVNTCTKLVFKGSCTVKIYLINKESVFQKKFLFFMF